MRDEDDGAPRRAIAHRVGEPLDALSVTDLAERIALLTTEIARLEAARAAKEAALKRADSLFRL
ncbi:MULTISPECIES: DUF1192 domain-containing protein [unclassified Methylobacterium]|uniref:DUF1192 domain-containing protein n=1 Tax=unclassified Methylobacterium TaxID=2615210 RepID=UPI0006F54F6A|nr:MULTISPECIES: DUF1192 domain-containing protein [unclassified Methylobacterium]KQP73045.1 hypothetical protein ASF60_10970 [Methylobacterium sp. Leaf113]KQP91818.1 hypothetical protein ASF57_04765 [Methylobacterium sp. Leaf117]MCK2052569.1 DUF1192 domain-containing protein [Methylobacterium sp. 37f]